MLRTNLVPDVAEELAFSLATSFVTDGIVADEQILRNLVRMTEDERRALNSLIADVCTPHEALSEAEAHRFDMLTGMLGRAMLNPTVVERVLGSKGRMGTPQGYQARGNHQSGSGSYDSGFISGRHTSVELGIALAHPFSLPSRD